MLQITQHTDRGGNRGYDTTQERDEDIAALREQGFDHFTTYRDTQASIALMYGKTLETEYAELTKKLLSQHSLGGGEPTTESDRKRLRFLEKCLADKEERIKSLPPMPRNGWMVRHPGYDLMY
jgi:hypothetical protein